MTLKDLFNEGIIKPETPIVIKQVDKIANLSEYYSGDTVIETIANELEAEIDDHDSELFELDIDLISVEYSNHYRQDALTFKFVVE